MQYQYPAHGCFQPVAERSTPPAYPLVAVHVLRGFFGNGKLLKVGQTVRLPEPDARDAVALGRADLV